MEKPCVFCQITNKQTLAKIIYEDDNSIAFLDRFPRSKGMTIIVPKQHYKDFDENFELSIKVFSSALIVAEMIKQALNPLSISFSVIESGEIPHFHIRIYPVYEDQIPLIENKPFETNDVELENIAGKIRGIKIKFKEEKKKEEKVEETKEKKEEKPRTKEEIYWMKRSMDIG